jgi:hemin uptake protein HemP
MSQPPWVTRTDDVGDVGGEKNDVAPSIESVTLMKGRRELLIRHGAETYRLRITASNKLILTK